MHEKQDMKNKKKIRNCFETRTTSWEMLITMIFFWYIITMICSIVCSMQVQKIDIYIVACVNLG